MRSIEKSSLVEVVVLVAILAFATFLYFYKLNSIPSGLYVDEALSGYNAYSLLKTGRDEYGRAFPVALRFFGSYTPPLYTYFTIPIVAVFGLNIAAVRLISVVSGILMILVIFHFLKLFKIIKCRFTPFLGALLFAISPWSVFYSRVGYEVNLAFFLFSLGILLVWLGFKYSHFLISGLFFLSLSTYAAHTERYLAPLFIVLLTIFFRKKLSKEKLKYIVGLIGAFLVQIPHITIITTPAFWGKTSMFYSKPIMLQASKIVHFLPKIVAIPLAFIREFLSQFFSYFSPRSLFFLPDPDPQRSMPELSVFYSWMVVPYFIGLYYIWRERREIESKFILILAISAAIPAALVGDPFSTQRALPLLLPLILIISFGIERLIDKRRLKVWLPVFLILVLGSLVLLWRSYFVFLPQERAKVWGYGFEQLAKVIAEHPDEKFLIDQSRTKPAYIELAFFMNYPPDKLQDAVDQSIRDNYYTNIFFNSEYNFGNIETRNIIWEKDAYDKQILVGDELAISPEQVAEHYLDKVLKIRDPIEQIVFQGFRTNPKVKCSETPRAYNKSKFCHQVN